MKAKKWLVIVTFLATIISLAGAFCFNYCCKYMEFWVNLSFAIFGSAALGLLMSLVEYFAAKRDALERYYRAADNLYKIYSKAQYFIVYEPLELVKAYFSETRSIFNESFPAKNALFEYMNAKWKMTVDIPEPEYSQFAQQEFDCVVATYRDQLVRTMETYILIADQSKWELESAYGELDFLISNGSLRGEIYNRIHSPIQEYYKFIAEKAYHFRSFMQAKNGNVAAMIGFVDEIQQKYYKTDIRVDQNGKMIIVYRQFIDELDNQLRWLLSRINREEYVPCKAEPYLGYSI